MNDAKIRLAILRNLKTAHPFALPEATLLANVNAEVRPAVKHLDFDDHLLFLKKAQLIVALPGQLGDVLPRWRITEPGLGEMA